MATLYITEYAALQSTSYVGGSSFTAQTPKEPAVATQIVAISGSSTQSSPFNPLTRFVRLHPDNICSYAFGPNPTAVTTANRMIAGQTEYFGVNNGDSVAVILNV